MNHVEQQGIAGKRNTHVLGLQWTTKENQLSLEPFKQHSEAIWTKRKIFSQFATLFDAFRWTAPATLIAKHFIRDLWDENWTWDEELPKQKKEEWNTIVADLANATTFVRTRRIPVTHKNCLDIFVDSSLSGYAAAAYLNGELYMAITRLAPVSQTTIFEFELMAMGLGSELGNFLQQTLQHLPIVVETAYWSNSRVCLA